MAGNRKWNPAHHPRDRKGRFTRSSTRVMKPADRRKLDNAIGSFDFSQTRQPPAGTPANKATERYLAGDWKAVNADLRRGVVTDDAKEIDAGMRPTDRDMIVTRRVPADMFAHIPLEDTEGMIVRDAAYAATSLGESDAPGEIRLRIAVPAGTPALVDPETGTVLLGRDTEMAVTRVIPNGDGGYDMHLVVLPKAAPPARGGGNTGPVDPAANVDLGALSDDELSDLFHNVSSLGDVDPAAFDRIAEELDRRDRQALETKGTDLAALDDAQLSDLFHDLSIRDDTDPEAFTRLLDEMERRENGDTTPETTVYAGLDPDNLTPEQQQLDDLLDQGRDFLDAWAETYGEDRDRLAREALASASIDRMSGEPLELAARRSYDELIHLRYLQASQATRGHMLSPAGKAAGIEPVTLFSGTSARARKYASEDLQRWWADNGRMTFTEFKAQTIGREADKRAAELTRLQGNARDFI